jgi:hypothetical protein
METLDMLLTGVTVVGLILIALVIRQRSRWNNIEGTYQSPDDGKEKQDTIQVNKTSDVDSAGDPVFTITDKNPRNVLVLGPVKWTTSGGERTVFVGGQTFAIIRMGMFSDDLIMGEGSGGNPTYDMVFSRVQ